MLSRLRMRAAGNLLKTRASHPCMTGGDGAGWTRHAARAVPKGMVADQEVPLGKAGKRKCGAFACTMVSNQ